MSQKATLCLVENMADFVNKNKPAMIQEIWEAFKDLPQAQS